MYLCKFTIFGFQYILLNTIEIIAILAFGFIKLDFKKCLHSVIQQHGTFG